MKHTIHDNNDGLKEVDITRGVAIKIHCTECMGFEAHPRECTSVNCALYPYRGKSHAAYVKEKTNERH